MVDIIGLTSTMVKLQTNHARVKIREQNLIDLQYDTYKVEGWRLTGSTQSCSNANKI